MKKFVVIFICLFILTGCSSDYKLYKAYQKYYKELLEVEENKTSTDNFDIELVVNKLSDNEYRYDIIIDNPKIAIYDITALMIVDNGSYDEENMMPSLGIFDEKYSLIPNEVDLSQLKAKGLNLSIVLSQDDATFRLMVEYTKEDKTKVKEYFIVK